MYLKLNLKEVNGNCYIRGVDTNTLNYYDIELTPSVELDIINYLKSNNILDIQIVPKDIQVKKFRFKNNKNKNKTLRVVKDFECILVFTRDKKLIIYER